MFIQQRWYAQYDTPKYHEMVKECDDLRREFHEMLGDDGVFLYPTYPTVAPYHREPVARWCDRSYSAIFNPLTRDFFYFCYLKTG